VQKEYIDYYPLYYPVFEEYNRIRMKYIKKKVTEIKKKRQEDREKLLEETIEIYRKAGSGAALKFLIDRGLPRSTAKYWINEKVPRFLKQGGVNEQPS